MKIIRKSVRARKLARSTTGIFRGRYSFCDRTSGIAYFHVETGPDGRFPSDQAAGLLAMHCMVRGQSPRDYAVLVPAEEHQLEGLYEKADKLLQAGQPVPSQIRLTRREEEVLNGLTRSLANKEIAISLNLSERTVKFYVSSLLAKFNVRGRVELVREACRHVRGTLPMLIPVSPRVARPFSETTASDINEPQTEDLVLLAEHQIMARV